MQNVIRCGFDREKKERARGDNLILQHVPACAPFPCAL